jgi:hypothetical protein
MARIIDIQKKSNAYVSSLEANVVRVIESGDTVNYNRVQMLNSKDAVDGSLVHKRTGSEYLSKTYARKTGKSKPNLFLSGDFQKKMFLTMPSMKEYFIASKDYKGGFLSKNYGQIFGISPANQTKVKEANGKAIVEDYLNKVFR